MHLNAIITTYAQKYLTVWTVAVKILQENCCFSLWLTVFLNRRSVCGNSQVIPARWTTICWYVRAARFGLLQVEFSWKSRDERAEFTSRCVKNNSIIIANQLWEIYWRNCPSKDMVWICRQRDTGMSSIW